MWPSLTGRGISRQHSQFQSEFEMADSVPVKVYGVSRTQKKVVTRAYSFVLSQIGKRAEFFYFIVLGGIAVAAICAKKAGVNVLKDRNFPK
ncbi:hypothetical protein BAU14_12465 [Enterococcus sp. CU9D]|nr:hypothetical protein BAU14_12465 [Enterococcus sp. CU9D]